MAWLRVSEFAEEQGVSPSTVRNWIKAGLPASRGPDGVTVVDPEVAEEWLDASDEEDSEEEGAEDEIPAAIEDELDSDDDDEEPDGPEDEEE